MTMHAAKGLEADVVFIYGGFGPAPNDTVRTYAIDGRRQRLAGRPRLAAIKELVKRERDGDDQRLFYVALTRARKRLFLPYSGNLPDEEDVEPSTREEYWRLAGGYRHVNRRLRELLASRPAGDCSPRATFRSTCETSRRLRHPPPAFAAWRPDPTDAAPGDGSPTLRSPTCAARAPAP